MPAAASAVQLSEICSAPRECLLCGRCESPDLEVFNNETYCGKWQSGCYHDACKPCLQAHIEAKLPACEAESMLAIACYASGCRKRLPQRLVLEVSPRAACFADGVDRGGRPCSRCGQFALLHSAAGCAHGACELCWAEVADTQDFHLQIKCWHPECSVLVEADFWRTVNAKAAAAQALRDAPAEMQRLSALAWRPGRADAPGPVCPVCRERRLALVHCGDERLLCSGHAACERCWARWAEGQLDRCVEARSVAVRCLWPECRAPIGMRLWWHLAGESSLIAAMARRLDTRARLQANTLFPEAVQVECPRTDCVGIGYLGYETVMCFLCEHQWSPAEGGEAVPDVDVEVVMGVKVKRCPKCNEFIEKNGGCDHMTCRCRHEFYWTTLKPYRAG